MGLFSRERQSNPPIILSAGQRTFAMPGAVGSLIALCSDIAALPPDQRRRFESALTRGAILRVSGDTLNFGDDFYEITKDVWAAGKTLALQREAEAERAADIKGALGGIDDLRSQVYALKRQISDLTDAVEAIKPAPQPAAQTET